jgi:hypothetical protein
VPHQPPHPPHDLHLRLPTPQMKRSTSSTSLPTTPPSPTNWFGLSCLNSGEERPNTSGVVDEDTRIMVRMTAAIQGDHQATKVLLPSGSCSANVSVPHKRCYAPIGADALMAFCSSRADHHPSVCYTGERSTAQVTPDCQPTPEIPLAVTLTASPTWPKTNSRVQRSPTSRHHQTYDQANQLSQIHQPS